MKLSTVTSAVPHSLGCNNAIIRFVLPRVPAAIWCWHDVWCRGWCDPFVDVDSGLCGGMLDNVCFAVALQRVTEVLQCFLGSVFSCTCYWRCRYGKIPVPKKKVKEPEVPTFKPDEATIKTTANTREKSAGSQYGKVTAKKKVKPVAQPDFQPKLVRCMLDPGALYARSGCLCPRGVLSHTIESFSGWQRKPGLTQSARSSFLSWPVALLVLELLEQVGVERTARLVTLQVFSINVSNGGIRFDACGLLDR